MAAAARHACAGSALVAWVGQRPGHGPGKLDLAQGALVAVDYSEARMNSRVFHFSIGLIQIPLKSSSNV
jgi:hypothetical protein